jgi:hypothetical protein
LDTSKDAIQYLITLRLQNSPPAIHPGWLREGAIGQLLGIEEEVTRMLDILCWHRDDARVHFSVPELVRTYGKQMAALSAVALYLHEFAGVTSAELAKSYETECGINTEHKYESWTGYEDSIGRGI